MRMPRTRVIARVFPQPRIADWLWLGAALLAWTALAQAQSSSGHTLAEQHYQKALAASSVEQKISHLQESLKHWQTFEAHYLLGEALAEQKRHSEALESFRNATRLTNKFDALARASFRIGLAYQAERKSDEAMAWLTRSLMYHHYPKVEEELKRLELDQWSAIVPAQTITRKLQATSRAGFVEPSINLRIGFAFNSAALDDQGSAQAKELSAALRDPMFENHRFIVVGHTDTKGTDEYNVKLSTDRAASVKKHLLKFGLSDAILDVEGKGETQPLYSGDSDDDHKLNRRVEIRVIPPRK